jgi:hypothetical protein
MGTVTDAWVKTKASPVFSEKTNCSDVWAKEIVGNKKQATAKIIFTIFMKHLND